MTDRERFARDGASSEETLARTLTELGPLLRRRVEVGEPDPAFAQQLRSRLLTAEKLSPRTVVVPGQFVRPSASPSRDQGTRPAAALRGRRTLALAGLAALVAAVLVVALVLPRLPDHSHAPSVAWQAPYPRLSDLTRGYPSPAVPTGPLAPTMSLAAALPGIPYPGRLRLTAPSLPSPPAVLRAFRLADPAAIVGRIGDLARLLGIHAPVAHIRSAGARWVVIAEGGGRSLPPLRSIAVSPLTGELVYHDAAPPPVAPVQPLTAGARAVAAARAWLTRLGWPGGAMPLQAVEPLAASATALQVRFGWVGAAASMVNAATVWVTPGGHVIEGRMWPPVVEARPVSPRSAAAAWAGVRSGQIPPAIDDVPPGTRAGGDGTVRQVTMVQVLTPGPDHRLYLAPAYRFAGTARLHGLPRRRDWYAVSPATATGGVA